MVTTLAKQRQKLSKYKLWRARFIILTLRQKTKKASRKAGFFVLQALRHKLFKRTPIELICTIFVCAQPEVAMVVFVDTEECNVF